MHFIPSAFLSAIFKPTRRKLFSLVSDSGTKTAPLLGSGNRRRAFLSVSYRNVSAALSHLNKVVCAGVETFAGQTGKICPNPALKISGSCYGGTTTSYILLSIAQLLVLSLKR
jgi:hypothetical protein